MATVEELYASLASFSEPAYTYIIRLPYKKWREIEGGLQESIKGGLWGKILEDEDGYKAFSKAVKPEHLYAMQYTCSLGSIAYQAAREAFHVKQSKPKPDFHAYVQVELTETVHIHLVLAGPGLSKHNAKGFRTLLALKFFEELMERQQSSLGPHYSSLENLALTVPIRIAAKDAAQNKQKQVSILQYKARNGDMYACRVDPKTFIANYMLPKNLWLNTYGTPEDFTPQEAFFIASSKTYAYSLLNGKEIPITIRRELQEKVAADFNGQKTEPVFGGDPYGDLPKVERASWVRTTQPGGHMTKREGLVLDLMNRAIEEDLLTYEQLVNAHPELIIMMESQAGGARLIEQTLNMAHIKIVQTHTALSYIQHLFPEGEVEPENKVFRLLNTQGYNAWQVGHWVCTVLNKKAGKQNTVCFYGPASTGKTNLAKAIVNTVRLYGCVNHQNKSFVFNDCAAKLVIWWEECLMHNDWVEQAKCCLGGTEFRIDRKHKDSQLLPQTPVIISTNHNIYEVTGGNVISHVHAKPLKDRVVQFNFMKCLPSTFGEIEIKDCADWLIDCATRFDCSLQGFYNQWGIDSVQNNFDLQVLCASHSQDYTLHEHGLCLACGGYLPLRGDPDSLGDHTPSREEQESESGTLSDFLSTPVKEGKINLDTSFDFDLSLLGSGSQPRTSTPIKTPTTEESITKRKRSDSESSDKQVSDKILKETYGQSENVFEYEERQERIQEDLETTRGKEARAEQESTPPRTTPSEWGERLGIIPGRLEEGEGPTTLYCFENLEDSETEMEQ